MKLHAKYGKDESLQALKALIPERLHSWELWLPREHSPSPAGRHTRLHSDR